MKGAEAADDDPGLDFTSCSFDALKALHTDPSRLQLPYPNVQPCDNLDAYESILQGKKRATPTNQDSGASQSRVDVGVALPGQGGGTSFGGKSKVVKSQNIPTVLTFMQKSEKDPFELLRLCYRDGAAVRVWIRHCIGVRGVCEGIPLAFDRHMNLVLCDVTERYVPFRTSTNGGLVESSTKKKRRNRKKQLSIQNDESTTEEQPFSDDVTSLGGHVTSDARSSSDHMTSLGSHVIPGAITRRVSQLFIRGDNIIMINSLLVKTQTQD